MDGIWEDEILEILQNTKDVSTGSEELSRHIRDWPTKYCLSAQRGDLLRPFATALHGKTVLQIGADGGAITRFLGECGALVLAVEYNDRLMQITKERCRGLSNVRVVRAETIVLEESGPYDVVLLTGVPGSGFFAMGDAFTTECIRLTSDLLKEEGRVMIVVDNMDGKAFPMTAEEEGYKDRRRIARLFETMGFKDTEYYFSFPDANFPVALLKERSFYCPGFNTANLIRPHLSGQLVGKGLLLAPGVLVVAGKNKAAPLNEEALAFTFNSARRSPFNKMNTFYELRGQGIRVNRDLYFPARLPERSLPLIQLLRDEAYIPGMMYSLELADILSETGWSVGDIQRWATPYFELLKSRAYAKDGKLWLEGIYVDLTPFNLLSVDGLLLEAIDLEWMIKELIPLEYVLFRGLYHSMIRMTPAALPVAGTPVNVFGLCLKLLGCLLPETKGVLEDFLDREHAYFSGVFSSNLSPGDADLTVAAEGIPKIKI